MVVAGGGWRVDHAPQSNVTMPVDMVNFMFRASDHFYELRKCTFAPIDTKSAFGCSLGFQRPYPETSIFRSALEANVGIENR